MSQRRLQYLLFGIGLCVVGMHALAESWPPLTPPKPMPVEWVVKHVMNRYPEVHANHRRYLAALERAVAPQEDAWQTKALEQEAEIARLHAVDHHLKLERDARHVFLDYWYAEQGYALATEQRRLWDAYIPAGKAREHTGLDDVRDFSLEATRLHLSQLKFDQARTNAGRKLNALLDRRHDAVLAPAALKEPSALPQDVQAVVTEALNAAPAMRQASAEVARWEALVERARAKPSRERNLAATLHELGSWQEQRRAVGAEIIREALNLHETARNRRDALLLYDQTLVPRADQQIKRLLAGYQAGRTELPRLLEAYEKRFDLDLERLAVRVEYEKALADLNRMRGRLPPEIERKMSAKPLNIGGAVK